MSYILEGLKKLEQKRKREEGFSRLSTFQEEKAERPARTLIWLYLLFFGLVLNAAVFVWWLGPWHSTDRTSRSHPTATAQSTKEIQSSSVEGKKQGRPIPGKGKISSYIPEPPSKPPILEKTKENLTPLAKKTPAVTTPPEKVSSQPESPKTPVAKKTENLAYIPEPASKSSVSETPKEIPNPLAKKAPAMTTLSEKALSQPESSKPPVAKNAVPEGPIVSWNSLPSEIKKNLPLLKMSFHYYSPDRQSRFVTINDHSLHEGETFSGGLRVVEINPEGTVLNFQGHRFFISIKDNF